MALLHNGITENNEELRNELISAVRVRQPDRHRVIAHLVDHLSRRLMPAGRRPRCACARVWIAVFRDEPHRVVGAREGSPLVLGVGTGDRNGDHFLASDAMALAGVTDQIAYLEEGDVIDMQLGKVWVTTRARGEVVFKPVQREVRTVLVHTGAAEMGPYRHYMQKNPRAAARHRRYLGCGGKHSPELFGDGAYRVFKDIDQVLILACGTSYYSGSVAKYWMESIAKIPVSVEIASEYRYRDSVPNPRTLVVTITQSGETADTLAALKHARSLGMKHTLTICNVATSAMVRECELAYITRAGTESGVASTKAFSTQLVGLFLLTLALAQVRGH